MKVVKEILGPKKKLETAGDSGNISGLHVTLRKNGGLLLCFLIAMCLSYRLMGSYTTDCF